MRFANGSSRKYDALVAHTMVLFFQMVTLNVAVNSYSNALLTLLISNQFVEIKGSVFKKFEKENLFQLSCSGRLEYVRRKTMAVNCMWCVSSSLVFV